MIKNEIIPSILIGFLVLLLVAAVWHLLRKYEETYEEEIEQEVSSELLQHIAEYRSYMVNQWVCLLAFWFNIKPEDAQTKLLCPAPNQNAVYFFHENIEVYTFFSWNDNTMEVKTSVFDEDDGYISHNQVFRIANGSLETDRLFDFISQAKKEHYGYYDLSADDVITITKQLKLLPEDKDKDAVKLQYFDTMAEFMIMMRQKKNRSNRKLFKTYIGLVHFLWQNYSEEFLKYLDMTEEQFLNIEKDDEELSDIKENSENIEGNE